MFKGHTEEKVEESLLDMLSVKPRIRFPLPGGTALVTFERPEGENGASPDLALKCSQLVGASMGVPWWGTIVGAEGRRSGWVEQWSPRLCLARVLETVGRADLRTMRGEVSPSHLPYSSLWTNDTPRFNSSVCRIVITGKIMPTALAGWM